MIPSSNRAQRVQVTDPCNKMMLHVGEDEILLDDARRYAERLSAAGSTGELHIWKGMVHVFPANLALLRAAREATDIIGAFLHRRLIDANVSSAPI